MSSPGQGDGEQPGISVIVPTHKGRFRLVSRLLDSLDGAAARIDEPWEVIVVDGAPPEEGEVLAADCHAHGARYVRGGKRVSSKRNLGARLARYDVLLFIDSDCVAGEELLAQHLRVHRSSGSDVAGVAGPTRMYGEEPFVWQVARQSRQYNQCYFWPLLYQQVTWCTTSNISFRTEVFRQAGGFAEDTFTREGGEDVDLGVRITDRGHRILSNPAAVVFHTREHITRVRQVARSLFIHGRADVFLTDRHPDRSDPYLNPWSAFAVASVVGVAGWAASRRKAAALLGPATIMALLGRELVDRTAPGLLGGRAPQPFGAGADELGQRLPTGESTGDRLRHGSITLVCVWLDSLQDLGASWEAVRRLRPAALFKRYRYLDSGFIPHRPDHGGEAAALPDGTRG